jgi:ATP-dependent Clp protease protease subunit
MSEEKKSSKGGTGEIWVHKFTEDSAAHFREQVLSIALKDSDYPIIIYIDSYGGSVDALAKMIDTLEQIENPIVTVCMGKAMSCGAILLSHGHVRYCAPNSRVLVHEVSGGVGLGDVHNQFNDAVEVKRLNVHFSGLLAHNCGIKGGYEGLRKVIKQRDGRDIWMNPKEALKFGLVDIIGTPVVHPLVAYQMFAVKAPPRTDRIKRARLILGLDRKMPK